MSFLPKHTDVGLLLAAGAGRRFGSPKALVVDDGPPWVIRSAQALLEGGCAQVLVVTGAASQQVQAIVDQHQDTRITAVHCATWQEGMGASLRAGLTSLAVDPRWATPDRVVVHLVDLPDVGPTVIARVLQKGPAGPGSLGRASYQGVPGHPVLLGRDHWQGVLDRSRGDAGARAYLRVHRPVLIECGDLATGVDVDVDSSQ